MVFWFEIVFLLMDGFVDGSVWWKWVIDSVYNMMMIFWLINGDVDVFVMVFKFGGLLIWKYYMNDY